MELNEELKAKVEACGKVGFDYIQVAAVLDAPLDDVCKEFTEKKGEIYSAWLRGRLQTELDLRNSMLRDATGGSGPILEKFINILKKTDEKHTNLIY